MTGLSGFWEFMDKGGVVMWPILASSVIGLTLFLERAWTLRRGRVIPGIFVERVRHLIVDGRRDEALRLAAQNGSPVANIVATAIRHVGSPRDVMRERVEEAGRHEAATFGQFVEWLGVVGAIAPLLGLLGTVTGMVSAFQRVEAMGYSDPRVISGGIWEALLTTVFGLIVAIPVYIGYRYISNRVNDLTDALERESAPIVERLSLVPARVDAASSENGIALGTPKA
jgi:biopolymer transport protein ExbB